MLALAPASSLLVVVDVQERLAPAMPAESLAEVVRAVTILGVAARELAVPTIATEQYPKGLGPTIGPVAITLAERGVTPLPKLAFSAMGEPAFAGAIARVAPRSVVVTGMEAHICVFQTVRDLRAAGFEVWVPWDGVASRRPRDRDVGLDLIARTGAHVTSAESIAFDWLGRAGGEAFRAVSKVVR